MRWVGIMGALGVVGAVGLIACGTHIDTDIEPSAEVVNASDGGGEGGTTNITDGSVADADAGPVLPTGGNGTVDECGPAFKAGPNDVYVTEPGSSDADCGKLAKPCSLSRALVLKPQTINIANGTYEVAVKLQTASIRIFGGWTVSGTEWKRTCETGKVLLKSLEPVGLSINDSAVTLSYVDVLSKETPTTGESLIGMLVMNQSQVTLDHVDIVAGAGGNGIDASLVPAIVGTHCTITTDETPGKDGDDGVAGGPGAVGYGPDGISVSSPGPGAGGAYGHAVPAPETTTDTSKGDRCVIGTVDSSACKFEDCFHNVKPEKGMDGCGGVGGLGGSPGTSAGSSIGLYVSSRSTVSVVSGSLKSGNGGNGGIGSDGSLGTLGVDGVKGANTTDTKCPNDGFDCGSRMAPACAGFATSDSVGGGPGGAAGGKGGNGGKGGLGAAGLSFTWARGATSNVELSGEPLLTPGVTGTGANAEKAPGDSTKVFKE